jgi:hypothetical protein
MIMGNMIARELRVARWLTRLALHVSATPAHVGNLATNLIVTIVGAAECSLRDKAQSISHCAAYGESCGLEHE